jgi:hypothetical protein
VNRITRILAVAAAPAVLAVSLLGASAASASTGPAGSNANAGHLTGNKSLIYQDPYFGGVQCNENQHPAFTNVTCKFVNGVAGSNGLTTSYAANFYVGETGQAGWVNDFGGNSIIGIDPSTGQPVPSTNGTLTYTVTGDATTGQVTGYTGQVVYTS